MNDGSRVRTLDGTEAFDKVDALAGLLIDCVEGGASVGFLRPLTRERARDFWVGVAQAVARGERILLVAEDTAGVLLGTVQLLLSLPENQPHRADVAKMLVHRTARRRGLAQRLLIELEAQARAAGRSVLVLDTVTGSDGDRAYTRAGWQRVGDIPNYALMPDGEYCSTTYFCRQL
jgi:GNAT superfamily N-acetyltransferase